MLAPADPIPTFSSVQKVPHAKAPPPLPAYHGDPHPFQTPHYDYDPDRLRHARLGVATHPCKLRTYALPPGPMNTNEKRRGLAHRDLRSPLLSPPSPRAGDTHPPTHWVSIALCHCVGRPGFHATSSSIISLPPSFPSRAAMPGTPPVRAPPASRNASTTAAATPQAAPAKYTASSTALPPAACSRPMAVPGATTPPPAPGQRVQLASPHPAQTEHAQATQTHPPAASLPAPFATGFLPATIAT
jgi:hypothetical protein